MKVVIDTNVLVSALLSPWGFPAQIARMAVSGNLRICYDFRILSEYKEVLGRPRFNVLSALRSKFLEQVCGSGESANASPWLLPLPDPSDTAFLEVALAAQAECLITGNLKHFPPSCRQGIRVLSPREFLEFYRDEQDRSSGKVKSPSAGYKTRKRR